MRPIGPVPAAAVLDWFPHYDADIVVPIGNGEPVSVLDAIEAAAPGLSAVRIHQMHALHDRRYLHGAYPGLRHISYFLSSVTRQAFRDGDVDLVPNHFSEVPALLAEHRPALVVAAVSPPDERGCFTLGPGADYAAALIGKVPFFVEVNPHVPRTTGANRLRPEDVVGWCEADYPLVALPEPAASDADRAIAAFVAERVPADAVLQAGIGAIPGVCLDFLLERFAGRHSLRIHTELFSDGFMRLMEAGACCYLGAATTTFAMGSERLYRWLDGNVSVQFQPVDYVNSPAIVGVRRRVVSIRATTEVDFLGQCASETVGGRYWSGSGGQVDFVLGARRSDGGQSFLCLRSRTRDGKPKIRPVLTEASAVTTTKNSVDTVVTEYGVAELRGRTIRERVAALIAVAHPDDRGWLTEEAQRVGYLPRGRRPLSAVA